jgi:hypothetical protein
MPPPPSCWQKDAIALSASPDSSPGSNPRPFSFGDLGRPRPSSPRLLPPIKDPDGTGELELCADDILESNDIDTFEVASGVVAVPAPAKSSGFEVGVVDAFDEIEVEGVPPAPATAPVLAPVEAAPALALAPVEPAPVEPAPVEAAPEPAPVSMQVHYTSPQPSTLIGMPAAPITSPLPLEESVIVSESPADRTQQMRSDMLTQVAEAAAFLDGDIPERTQVLVRADMPASIQGPRTLPTGQTPPPTSVHTPSAALAVTAAAWPNGRHPVSSGAPITHNLQTRPSSTAPVAVDIARGRPTMPSIPVVAPQVQAAARPAPSGVSGLLIGGLAFAAVALIGVVGVGGYLASRTLSDKAESIAIAPAPEPASTSAAAAAPADPPAGEPAAAAADPASAPVTGGVDVSSLPSAPVRAPAVAVAAASPAPAAPPAAPRTVVGSTGGSRPSGGSTQSPPTSTGRSGAPLPPPGAANASPQALVPAASGGAVALPPPPPKAAPAAAPAVASTTGNVNVDPKLRAVVVDGAFRRVNDGVLTLSCGTHRIKVGMNDPQSVNVPCGGSVSL